MSLIWSIYRLKVWECVEQKVFCPLNSIHLWDFDIKYRCCKHRLQPKKSGSDKVQSKLVVWLVHSMMQCPTTQSEELQLWEMTDRFPIDLLWTYLGPRGWLFTCLLLVPPSRQSFHINTITQRLFFLRQLRKCGVSKVAMLLFYREVIESVLTFSITIAILKPTRKKLTDRVVRTTSKIIVLPTISELNHIHIQQKGLTSFLHYSVTPVPPQTSVKCRQTQGYVLF